MIRRLPTPDVSDTLCMVGVLLIAVTVYFLWPLWTPAFVGGTLILFAVMREVGQRGRRQ